MVILIAVINQCSQSNPTELNHVFCASIKFYGWLNLKAQYKLYEITPIAVAKAAR